MAKAKTALDKEIIKELAELLNETGLTEIEFERDGMRLRVARGGQVVSASVPQAAPPAVPQAAAPAAALEPAKSHAGAVKSPMVGTAYMSPSPGAAAFISVGQTVKAGQTIIIIEAMKTMNQIPSTKAGTVKEILVQDGQPVEFDEPLVIIE